MIDLRIFISSPGDVAREREVAQRVIERLQGEYAAQVRLLPYFWEHEPMLANAGDYQENIPAPGDFDVFVCLLWSRLGTRLHSRHRTADGVIFDSGTVYEFRNALAAASVTRSAARPRGTPDMLVFLKTAPFDPPHAPPLSRAERDERLRQFDALQDFINDAFRDPQEGAFNIAANSFADLAAFELLLEKGLRKTILDHLPSEAAAETAPPATWKRGAPYFGLRAFDLEDAPVFFGRTAAVDAVLTRWLAHAEAGCAFCLLFGSSGVGKSSLARAGVLPLLLRPGVVEGIALWRYTIFQPRDGAPREGQPGDLFLALSRALLRREALPELAADGTAPERLAAMLRAEPGAIAALIKGGLSQAAAECARERQLRAQPAARLALLVDQLEELFTQEWITEAERAAFIHALAVLAESGLVFVVATLRADFFSRCETLPELMALKDGLGHYHVEPPRDFELGQMIRLPAQAAGLRFERDAATGESLDERLRDDALRSPDALPLLAFALERLWLERDAAQQRLTFASYAALGGLEGALRTQAEAMHDAWARVRGAGAAPAFDAVMRQLVASEDRSGAGARYARAWVEKSMFSAGSAEGDFVERAIAARLFVADAPEAGASRVALAHEALLRAWPRLATWLAENRAFLRDRARLENQLAEWLAQNRPDDLLLPAGLPYEAARALAAKHRRDLSPAQLDFVARSAARLQRAARRKALAIAAAFIALAALTLAALDAARRARVARAAAETARGDADELNLFLLGDLRERLEEAGRVELLDAAAERAGAYLVRLNATAGGGGGARAEAAEVMRLQLAFNLARVRLKQGRLSESVAALAALDVPARVPPATFPAVARARARLLNARCDILASTAENAAGQAAGREAIDLLAPFTDADAVLLGADTRINLADLLSKARDHSGAAREIADAVASCEPLAVPTEARIARRTLLRALLRQCDLAAGRSDLAGAQATGEQRLALAQRYAGEEPLAPLWFMETALSHDRLALVLLRRGQLAEAQAQADAALQIWTKLTSSDPANREWLRLEATAHVKRGQIDSERGHAVEAVRAFLRAGEINYQLVKAAPGNLIWRAGLATSLSLLGDAIVKAQEAPAAAWRLDARVRRLTQAPDARDAEALRRRRRGEAPRPTGPIAVVEIEALLKLKAEDVKQANARDYHQAALKIRRELCAQPAGRVDVDNTRNFIVSLTKTAAEESNAGNDEAAERLAGEAVPLARELGGRSDALPDHRALLASALAAHAETLVARERQREGAALYVEARDLGIVLVRELPADPAFRAQLADVHLSLAALFHDGTHAQPAATDAAAARAEFTAARELLQKLAQEFPQNARYREALAEAEAGLSRSP